MEKSPPKKSVETLASLRKRIRELEEENKKLSGMPDRPMAVDSSQGDSIFRRVVNSNLVGVFITDFSGKIISANQAIALMLGYQRPDDLQSVQVTSVFADPASHDGILERIRQDGSIENFEVIFRKQNSETITASLTMFIEGTQIWGMALDISDRKKQEEEITRSERRFRELSDMLPEVVYEADIDGFITFVNKKGFEKFGYTAEDLKAGIKFTDLIIPEDHNTIKQNRLKALAGLTEPFEYIALRKDGSRFPVVVHATRYMDHDKIVGTRGLVIDITAQKKTESRLKLNELRLEAMLQLSQIKDEPIGRVTDFVLEKAVEITGSTIGYLAFTNEEETFLTMYSWSKTAMEECRINDKPIIYPVNATGLWGEAIRQRKPVITNNYAAPNPHKKGYPEGHVPVVNHMNVPIFDGKHIVMLIGVGNKPHDYEESDVMHLTLLMNELWRIIKKQEEEDLLTRSEVLFNSTINSITDWIHIVDCNLEFLYMNKALRDVSKELGMAEDIEGRNIGEIFPFLPETAYSEYRQVIETGKMLVTTDTTAVGQRNVITETYKWPVLDESGKVVRIVTVIRDITAKSEDDRNLKIFAQTIHSANDTINICDLDHRITYVNKAFCDLYGYSEAEVIGKHINIVRSPNNPPEIDQAIADASNESGWSGELLNRKNDGTEIVVNLSASVIRDENDIPIARMGIARDVTELKNEKEKLRLSEEKFRSLFTEMRSAFALHDIVFNADGDPDDYRFLEVNPAFERMTGLKGDEIIGKTARSVIPDLEPFWLENYSKVAMTGEPAQFESYTASLKKYYDVRAYNAGKNRFAVLFHDITERRITEDALRESEERYRTVIENTGEGVSIVDDQECIFFANRAAENIFGVNTGELIGHSLREFTNELAFEVVLSQTSIRKMGISSSYEHEIIRKDGEVRTLMVTATPRFNKNNEYIGTFSVFRDISERKIFEKELIRARDRAEQADRLKSAFLANMSHEIRTPLNGILGFTSILKMDQTFSEKNRSYLDIIDESGNQLLKLINDIIDISKIEAGQLQIVEKEFPLNYLLAELYNFFSSYIATYKKSRLELTLTTALPDNRSFLLADEYRLRQVLTNLIGNAIKFTSTGSIEFGYTVREDQMLEFFVTDTGMGVSPDQVDIIFERFRQGDEGIGRKYGGTGLGLAITRELVELMGGFIWLKSKTGNGSAFYFTIPYRTSGKDQKLEKAPSGAADSYDWTGKTILIGEDVDASFMFLSILLKKTNIKVIHARDGREVLDIMNKEPIIDLLLLDIQLPIINGYEVARQLRKSHPDFPIIAQTANAFEEDKGKCLDAGCNNYIAKPIKKDALLSMIAQYI